MQQMHIEASLILGDAVSAAKLFASNISFFFFFLFVHPGAAWCYPVEKSLLHARNILNKRKNSTNSLKTRVQMHCQRREPTVRR